MQFLKTYLSAIIFTIFASIALLTGAIVGLIGWTFIPPIAHIFTDDGIEYTKMLLGKWSSSLKNLDK